MLRNNLLSTTERTYQKLKKRRFNYFESYTPWIEEKTKFLFILT